jgi:fibronectin-binding autotransporter adhesin
MRFKARARSALVLLVTLLATAGTGRAQTYNWDPAGNGTLSGGTGTWDTSSAFWFNGTTDVAWPGGSNVAVFGGTMGTVTLAPGGITAGGLTINTTGYTIAGTDALTLSGSGATVTVAPLLVAGTSTARSILTATISAPVGGRSG